MKTVAVLIGLLCCLWVGIAEEITQLFNGTVDVPKILPALMRSRDSLLKILDVFPPASKAEEKKEALEWLS